MDYQTCLKPENPVVTMKIKGLGTITLELFYDIAPNSVCNFIQLIDKKYYDGLVFHRVIPGFMIQGGWGDAKSCEIKGEFKQNGFNNPLKHARGVLSMARTNDPNSATSQFFIMHQNSPHLDGAYAGFGVVTAGIEVVDKIVASPRDYRDRPYTDVVIESVTVDKKNKSYPAPVCYSKDL
jgi:peptidyl-prolyl cis-trans isomerase B (cyclophilin B)